MQFELTNKKPDEEDNNPVEWVKWYEGVKSEGDTFSIKADRISFKNDEQPVFFIVDESDNKGISVFCAHHPNATFTDATPHGIRLANAIGRAFNIEGNVEASDLCEAVNNANATVEVKKTAKGILWTVLV